MAGDVKKWEGSPITTCNLCQAPIISVFIDGKVCGRGWAIMCPDCCYEVGAGIGTGLGQMYKLEKDGSWIKIAG